MRKANIESQDEVNIFNWMEKAPSVKADDATMWETTIEVAEKPTIEKLPLMKQYEEMKRKYPKSLLLFRVGDFYETLCEDAIEASRILGITLTRRASGKAEFIELAGFPHHALDTYLPKLVKTGRSIAICEQLEDPKLSKKTVRRD